MLDVDTEAQLLQHPPLQADHAALQPHVVRVQDHGFDRFAESHLFYMIEHIDHVSGSPRLLLTNQRCVLFVSTNQKTGFTSILQARHTQDMDTTSIFTLTKDLE